MTKPEAASAAETDDGYAAFEAAVRARVAAPGPFFDTDADPAALWDAYLNGLPAERRQHYNCSGCRRFIERHGGLVTIDARGLTASVLWDDADGVPAFFRQSVAGMRALVRSARVTGVFLSSEPAWGRPAANGWTHLGGVPAALYAGTVLAAGQAAAAKTEDRAVLVRSLADYSADVAAQAARVLEQGGLYRSEKAEAVAAWFVALHGTLAALPKGTPRENALWAAVAAAPPGFTHVRSTVISTLLDDVVAGLPFADISRRWAEKLHPLQYQRPTAPPTAGAIAEAEKLVERLGLAPAFARRYATLADVLATEWAPPAAAPPTPGAASGGLFGHLRAKAAKPGAVDLPAVAMTWDKFRRTVLPGALSVEVLVPASGPFYGLVTATDPDAPPIFQWDGLPDRPRNPVNWYFHGGGHTPASAWNLSAGWAAVSAVFLAPPQWQDPDRFAHQGKKAFFAVTGCRDVSQTGSLCLFPECLRSELHGARRVIEAHSNVRRITDGEAGNANGLAFNAGGNFRLTVRVRTPAGPHVVTLDRWD